MEWDAYAYSIHRSAWHHVQNQGLKIPKNYFIRGEGII